MKSFLKTVLSWGNPHEETPLVNTIVKEPDLPLTKNKGKYPKEVEEIHRSFNVEAEALMNEAKSILSNLSIKDSIKNKAELAKSFGFENIKEVKELKQHKEKVNKHETILKAVMESIEYIPTAKWIPVDSVGRICKQWGLVFGYINQYKGFVPNKNLMEIKHFKDSYNNLFRVILHTYTTTMLSSGLENSVLYNFSKSDLKLKDQITEAQERLRKESGRLAQEAFESGDYEMIRKLREHTTYNINRFDFNNRESVISNSLNKEHLKICAPIKDMEISKHQQVKDGWKIENIPDPIVLARHDFNGIEGYYIVTAWGDEASDEEVEGYNG